MPSIFLVKNRPSGVITFARPFSDPFARPDAATLGAPWIQPASGAGSGIGIVSGRAAKAVGGSGAGFGPLSVSYALLPYGSGVQDFSVDHILVASGSAQAYLIFGATASMSTYYVLGFNGDAGSSYNQFISKFVGSTETDYVTSMPITSYAFGAPGASARWRLVFDPATGATTAYWNGTQVASTTVSLAGAGTYVGIAWTYGYDATTLALDNFATA